MLYPFPKISKYVCLHYDAYGGVDKLLQDINTLITELTGSNITFENKPIKDFHDIQIMQDINKSGNAFDDVSKIYELDHCKIINKAIFIKSTSEIIFLCLKLLK